MKEIKKSAFLIYNRIVRIKTTKYITNVIIITYRVNQLEKIKFFHFMLAAFESSIKLINFISIKFRPEIFYIPVRNQAANLKLHQDLEIQNQENVNHGRRFLLDNFLWF